MCRAKVANCVVGMVYYDLNQPPPPEECLLWKAYDVPVHLVLGPDELLA